jgi:hypothetical protein
MNEPTSKAAAPETPKKPDLKNSHWCIHPQHGLGMIGEIGAQVTFHRYRDATKDQPAGVHSTPEIVQLDDLSLCEPDDLPEHLGYTEQQLRDFGYSR